MNKGHRIMVTQSEEGCWVRMGGETRSTECLSSHSYPSFETNVRHMSLMLIYVIKFLVKTKVRTLYCWNCHNNSLYFCTIYSPSCQLTFFLIWPSKLWRTGWSLTTTLVLTKLYPSGPPTSVFRNWTCLLLITYK